MSFVDAAFPSAPLCVCTQGGTGRTSSRPPELHECPSSHRCLSGCGSPHQCSLHTAAITLSPEPRKAPDGGFVSRPHLGAAAAACFPGCPSHPSLRPSGPALLSHQWYACLHRIFKRIDISSNKRILFLQVSRNSRKWVRPVYKQLQGASRDQTAGED